MDNQALDPVKAFLRAVGQKGGKAQTPAKRESSARNLQVARAKRWPKKEAQKVA